MLDGRQAVVGPPRPWLRARSSYDRAARTAALAPAPREGAAVDSEEHLADLVVGADPEALADLRARVLAPLADLRPATRDRLAETLRSWLLHQGRRDEVAAELHVHAQTVRYRMGQLRELYGDRLDDPRTVLEVVVALHGAATAGTGRTGDRPEAVRPRLRGRHRPLPRVGALVSADDEGGSPCGRCFSGPAKWAATC